MIYTHFLFDFVYGFSFHMYEKEIFIITTIAFKWMWYCFEFGRRKKKKNVNRIEWLSEKLWNYSAHRTHINNNDALTDNTRRRAYFFFLFFISFANKSNEWMNKRANQKNKKRKKTVSFVKLQPILMSSDIYAIFPESNGQTVLIHLKQKKQNERKT